MTLRATVCDTPSTFLVDLRVFSNLCGSHKSFLLAPELEGSFVLASQALNWVQAANDWVHCPPDTNGVLIEAFKIFLNVCPWAGSPKYFL